MTARAMNQFDRSTLGAGGPAVAPRHHRDDQRIQVPAFVCESILKAARTLLILNADEDAIIDQPSQTIRQPMRRHPKILEHAVEPPDAEEGVADYQHRPSIADDRKCPCD